MTKIPFNKLYVGLDVIFYFDEFFEYSIGTITGIDDIHNIFIESIGFNGIFCLDENCIDYDPIYWNIEDERRIKLESL